MTTAESLDSIIQSLTRVVDGNHALPNHMVRDVRDTLVHIRLAIDPEPQSLRVDDLPRTPELRLVK